MTRLNPYTMGCIGARFMRDLCLNDILYDFDGFFGDFRKVVII